MRRFGSRVTLIARDPQLAPKEDADVAQAILELFRDEGIEVLLRTQVLSVKGISGERVEVLIENEAGTRAITGTDILAALGRVPNTHGIGLEKAGIEVTEAGHIRVNDRLETKAPNVWAVGECAGSPYFTHVSENDFHIIHANLNGENRSTRDVQVAMLANQSYTLLRDAVFTHPTMSEGLGMLFARVPERRDAAVEKRDPRGSML